MRIGSLFSGAGMLDKAVEHVFGGETVWHCEIDKAASKVLAHRWPSVPNLSDITAVDWTQVEPVDVFCGGFPCQDLSSAGRRAGLRTGNRSGLWEQMAGAIAVLGPRWVVIENVKGLLHGRAHRDLESDKSPMGDGSDGPILRAAGAVLGDLADLGYDAQWATVSAASVGAPHRRDRVFILGSSAHAGGYGCGGGAERDLKQATKFATPQWNNIDGCSVADGGDNRRTPVELFHTPLARDGSGLPPHPAYTSLVTDVWELVGRQLPDGWGTRTTHSLLLPTPQARDGAGAKTPEQVAAAAGLHGPPMNLNDYVVNEAANWGKYAAAIHRWEQLTRPAPMPTEPNRTGKPRLAAEFSEWLMGWPAGHVTQVSDISRSDQLRIIGNGVVPQQATAALRYLLSVSEVAA